MWEKRNPGTQLVGMQAGASTLEKNLEACLKSKYRSAIGASNPTLKDIPKRMQQRLLQRHLHTHVYCSTIHNSQIMEIAKMPNY
jgi:hypothetical protein